MINQRINSLVCVQVLVCLPFLCNEFISSQILVNLWINQHIIIFRLERDSNPWPLRWRCNCEDLSSIWFSIRSLNYMFHIIIYIHLYYNFPWQSRYVVKLMNGIVKKTIFPEEAGFWAVIENCPSNLSHISRKIYKWWDELLIFESGLLGRPSG